MEGKILGRAPEKRKYFSTTIARKRFQADQPFICANKVQQDMTTLKIICARRNQMARDELASDQ
jgi:hypothetical protein